MHNKKHNLKNNEYDNVIDNVIDIFRLNYHPFIADIGCCICPWMDMRVLPWSVNPSSETLQTYAKTVQYKNESDK
jgi:hypothetical protein